MKTNLATFVCVWHPDTDELLFESHSTELDVATVRKVAGEDAIPAEPEPMTAYPVSEQAGRRLLAMMGKRFEGEGEFQVSREFVDRPDRPRRSDYADAGDPDATEATPRTRICAPSGSAFASTASLWWTLAPFLVGLSLTLGLAAMTQQRVYAMPMSIAVVFTALVFGMRHALALTAINTIAFNYLMVNPVLTFTAPSCSEWSRFAMNVAFSVGIPLTVTHLASIRDWTVRAEKILFYRWHYGAPDLSRQPVRRR